MKQYAWMLGALVWFVASAASSLDNADSILRNRLNTPLIRTEGTMTGEGLCWHAAYDMGRFMEGYKKTRDADYLTAAVQYYDALIEKMHRSPDGYQGWVGTYIYDKEYICDVHIGDAILINPMLEFCEIVLKHEDDGIVQKYQNKAQQYLTLAKKHLIEKWDQRGTWHEDGPYGAYASWDHYMTKENLNQWRKLPAIKSNLTLPFNKQNSMAIACLRIFRITGEEAYREKALKIFNFMKSRMCLFQDHYVWNYWEPFGAWDIEDAAKNRLRHWVNVHPYRNYQSGEIYEIAEAYHSGLTFTQKDIERIINTNLKVMWNGDLEKPSWRNSNYAVQMAALGEIPIRKAPGGEFPRLAGALWTGLSDFSATIRKIAKKNEDAAPPSFKRHYSELPITTLQRPFHSSRYFTMAAAVPSVMNPDQPSYLICQARTAGSIVIELYSNDGKQKIAMIRNHINQKDQAGPLIIPWTPKDAPKGEHRIRWTLDDDYREFPILIQ